MRDGYGDALKADLIDRIGTLEEVIAAESARHGGKVAIAASGSYPLRTRAERERLLRLAESKS